LSRSHSKSIIREVIERLDSLMRIGMSRAEAKRAAQERGESTFAFTTGFIHSFKTRQVYQEHSIRFAKWARDTFGVKQFAELEIRADELASNYLRKYLAEQKKADTLQTIRASLRMLFRNRRLAQGVEIPQRLRENITRSRGPKAHDQHFQPANWVKLLNFLDAVGLRRDEVTMLKVGDICEHDPEHGGQTTVKVRSGKGGKKRTVVVDPGQATAVLLLKEGRADEERVFEHIPKHLDVHSHRRDFSGALYKRESPDHELPPADKKRLSAKDYDPVAAQKVTEALGHHRRSIILKHYIR